MRHFTNPLVAIAPTTPHHSYVPTAAQGDDRYDKGRPRASISDWLRRPLPGTGEAGAPSQRALPVGGLEHGNGVPAGQFDFHFHFTFRVKSQKESVKPILVRTSLPCSTRSAQYISSALLSHAVHLRPARDYCRLSFTLSLLVSPDSLLPLLSNAAHKRSVRPSVWLLEGFN